MIEDPVVSDVEWAKERDLELGVAAARNDFGATLDRANRTGRGALSAIVHYSDFAIGFEGVIGCHAFAASLEAVFISTDLIPPTSVTLEVDPSGRLLDISVAHRADAAR